MSRTRTPFLIGLLTWATVALAGASAAFGGAALAISTTVKLARAVWISPCVLVAGWLGKGGGKAAVPLFIVGFIAAAALRWLIEHPDLPDPGDDGQGQAVQGVLFPIYPTNNTGAAAVTAAPEMEF